jgi:hypothetical protein
MSVEVFKKLDEEQQQFFDEFREPSLQRQVKLKEILGFDVKGSKVYIPDVCELATSSVFSLLPIYDKIYLPIFANFGKQQINNNDLFKRLHGLYPQEIILGVEEGRIIPYLKGKYQDYSPDIMNALLKPGMPILNSAQIRLVELYGLCELVEHNCKLCMGNMSYKKSKNKMELSESCFNCANIIRQSGADMSFIKNIEDVLRIQKICFSKNLITANKLDAIFSTKCETGKQALNIVNNVNDTKTLDYIYEGLNINYTEDIPLVSYLELLDSKTTKAIRTITNEIISDPYSKKYHQRLDSKIYELNQQVLEIGKSKSAKIYKTLTDLSIYSLSKVINKNADDIVKLEGDSINNAIEWIASKVFDLHMSLTGKDWTIAQLYKFKCNFDKCREPHD